ncbi:MAG: aminotransferase class I/II-fold pyridoxal phosphate-dependent enzyme [Pseudomonadales bacterium]|nr:aminotransferase class I/II-fold pyridoxal phosphate-dependent enzyme [Pseudomonadales bacterium]
MTFRPAARLAAIRSFQVMDLVDRAQALEREGRDIVHMEVGEPDFPSAPPILEAGARSIMEGPTGYTSALGLPALREGIAAYYARWHGVDVPPERIVVTAGATGALVLLAALLVEPGDTVLMTDPCYPCNRYFPELVGGHAQTVPVGPDRDYQLDAELLARHWGARTRGLLAASPANPTGGVLGRGTLVALLEAVRERDGWAIIDEIYQGLTYPAELVPLPARARHGQAGDDRVGTVLSLGLDPEAPCFVVNSFSKYFGMTGWRIGWLVAPHAAVGEIEKLAQNFYIAPSTIGQHAALAALSDPAMEVHETRRRAFCDRRNLLVAGLRDLGFGVARVPEGAFYVYARLPAHCEDSFAFCGRLLEHHGVAATPGTDFGVHEADRHVRFAYTANIDRLRAALERLAEAVAVS